MAQKFKDVDLLDHKSHDSLDVGSQLAHLRKLKDGWAEGLQPADQWGQAYGKAPPAQGIDWLEDRYNRLYAAHLPAPYVYPTPEGGVSLEWSIAQNEASLEIDLYTHSAEWHCLNLVTGQSTELILDLNADEHWQRLVAMIRELGHKDA